MTVRMNSQQKIIADYREGPNMLEEALTGLSEADLDTSPVDEGWSIRKIVHHLTDGDDIWKSFIMQAIGNPGGEFRLNWYWQIPQDEWAKRWNYESRAIETSLAMFRASRNHTVQLLEHAPEVLENCLLIRWPKGGEQEVNIRWVLEMQTQHVAEHAGDIVRIRDFHGI